MQLPEEQESLTKDAIRSSLRQVIAEMRIDDVERTIAEAFARGLESNEIISTIRDAAQIAGQRFEAGETFLTDLLMIGETLKAAVNAMGTRLEGGADAPRGTIVAGSVEGDLHDIGKNLFLVLAKVAGFGVVDLGVDVGAKSFVEGAKAHDASILGMSALLSTTTLNMRYVIEAVNKSGIRAKLRIILGGAPIADDWARSVGADAGVNDAVRGVIVCSEWVGGLKI